MFFWVVLLVPISPLEGAENTFFCRFYMKMCCLYNNISVRWYDTIITSSLLLHILWILLYCLFMSSLYQTSTERWDWDQQFNGHNCDGSLCSRRVWSLKITKRTMVFSFLWNVALFVFCWLILAFNLNYQNTNLVEKNWLFQKTIAYWGLNL